MNWIDVAYIAGGVVLTVLVHYLRVWFRANKIDQHALEEFAAEMEAYLEAVKPKSSAKKVATKKPTTKRR